MVREEYGKDAMNTYLVTATPPTPNGDLHVGHLAGPFLAADVFTRFQRMRGNKAIYLSSSDGNQSYVMTTARRFGWDPGALAASFTEKIKDTLRAAEIQTDLFPSAVGNAGHGRFVQDWFKLLYERRIIVAQEHAILFCPRCSEYLFESFAKGRCPYCGEDASGNLCEACGRVYESVDLVEPVCSFCEGRPGTAKYRGLFLPLERYRPELEEFYASRTSWRPRLRALCRSLLSEPLVDYPVSYPGSWGIPVPLAGFENQVINVWLEMYPGHVYTTKMWCDLEGDPELADHLWTGDAATVQFLGYDNSFFNAVLHVALALALGRTWQAPEHIITNEFYFLDGAKFSTSRDHAIWGREILAEAGADALRYHVSRTNPEHWQTNFSHADFDRSRRGELEAIWDPVVSVMLRTAAGGSRGRTDSVADLQVQGLIGWAACWLERYYDIEEFSLRQASAVLLDYVLACREYMMRGDAGRERGAEQQACGAAALGKALALFAAPLMPGFGQRLWAALGLEGRVECQRWEGHADASDARVLGEAGHEWFPGTGIRSLQVA